MLFLCVYKNPDNSILVNRIRNDARKFYHTQIGLYDAEEESDAKEKMAEDLIPHIDAGENNYERKCEKREDNVEKTKQFITAKGINEGPISL